MGLSQVAGELKEWELKNTKRTVWGREHCAQVMTDLENQAEDVRHAKEEIQHASEVIQRGTQQVAKDQIECCNQLPTLLASASLKNDRKDDKKQASPQAEAAE